LECENLVFNYLNALPKDYFVFNDAELPEKRGNIDHVEIGPTGIRHRNQKQQWTLSYKG
jgi:hypothetical protein